MVFPEAYTYRCISQSMNRMSLTLQGDICEDVDETPIACIDIQLRSDAVAFPPYLKFPGTRLDREKLATALPSAAPQKR